jgi:hypothetical protein
VGARRGGKHLEGLRAQLRHDAGVGRAPGLR